MLQKQRLEVFCKKGVLKNFAKFKGKHLCWSLFLNKVAAWPAALLKSDSGTSVCCEFCKKILEHLFFIEHLRLLVATCGVYIIRLRF